MNEGLRRKWILWFALASHLSWAVILIFDPSAAFITSIHSLAMLVGDSPGLMAGIYAVAVMTAGYGILLRRRSFLGLLALLPQQLLLLISAGGAIESIVKSAFADGVVRPRGFLAADQGVWIILAVLHTLSLMDHYGRAGWRNWQ